MKELMKRLRLLKLKWRVKVNKKRLATILIVAAMILLFAILHARSVKKNQDNSIYEGYLKKEIQDKQNEIDQHKKNIADLKEQMSNLKGDVIIIDNKSQTTKKKYKDEKRYIDLATPSQQSTLLSTNLSQLKDLDRKGYFDLP
jgi:peptidoglycan hydrolase CwlO-like protein